RRGNSGVAAGCTGGLGVRIIFAIFTELDAAAAAAGGRVVFPTGERADLDAFGAVARAPFALFFTVRVFADRPGVFAECLLMLLNIAAKFVGRQTFLGRKSSIFNRLQYDSTPNMANVVGPKSSDFCDSGRLNPLRRAGTVASSAAFEIANGEFHHAGPIRNNPRRAAHGRWGLSL